MLEKLILYFVEKTKGYITKTQLVKFLYLADLYAVKWTGKQLTELDWRFYKHGPWHEEIDAVLNSLKQNNQLCEVSSGNTRLIKLTNINYPGDFQFSESLELMLDNIRKEWAGAGNDKFNDLLNYVYQTEPMKEAISKYKPEQKAQLNLQLEREKLLLELGV